MNRAALPLIVFGLSLAPQTALAEEPPAEDACEAPVTAREVMQTVASAHAAYADLDLDGFKAAHLTLSGQLPCLVDSLSEGQTAGVHGVEALASFVDNNPAATVASFRSVLAAAPSYRLPEDLARSGHPLRTMFDTATGALPSPTAPMPQHPSREGWVHVDGTSATTWPVDRPYLVQAFDDAGRVTESGLYAAGAPPFGIDTRGSATAGRHRSSRMRQARVLAGVSAGSALVAGGLYLGARAAHTNFWDPSTPTADVEALRTRANALGWASAGVGAIAVGTGGAAVLVGTW